MIKITRFVISFNINLSFRSMYMSNRTSPISSLKAMSMHSKSKDPKFLKFHNRPHNDKIKVQRANTYSKKTPLCFKLVAVLIFD